MSYDEANVRWNKAWLWLWVFCTVELVALAHFLTPGAWLAAFFALFLAPELVGLRIHQDTLPPLTYAVRRYLPRWIPTAATFAGGAWLAMLWVPTAKHPAVVAVVIATFVGWLTNHWDVTYDA